MFTLRRVLLPIGGVQSPWYDLGILNDGRDTSALDVEMQRRTKDDSLTAIFVAAGLVVVASSKYKNANYDAFK